MSRPLRIEYDGAVYHVTSRGNARKPIFIDELDRKNFLYLLFESNKRFSWICHAYCLMNNHYHLVIETPSGNLSKGMRQLNGVYTQLFNRRHGRVGHIFQGRYKAILIEKEGYLLEVCRYVVLNPVRAKTVEDAGDWEWSSYRGMAGTEKPHPCVTNEWLLAQFGSKKKQAESEYRMFVLAGVQGEKLWKAVKGQSVLGKDDFVARLATQVVGYQDIKEIPKNQRYVGRPQLMHIFNGRTIKDTKTIATVMRMAIFEYGYSLKEVADFLGIHYSTVSRAVRKNNTAQNKT